MKSTKLVYLDYAATTPIDPRVKKAMAPFESIKFGNPSSLHQKGREAKMALDDARKKIAKIINAKADEIVFTAGGTESVNLAIFGVAKNLKNSENKGSSEQSIEPVLAPRLARPDRIGTDSLYVANKKYHLITSSIEHHCVLHSFSSLAGDGYETSLISVDKHGRIDFEKLKNSIRSETILISVMFANNEIGTIQPIEEIGKWLKQVNTQRRQQGQGSILFHTDACQAAGYLDLNVQRLGVDLMSVNGSKIYGPKQTGFLYVKSGTQLSSLIYGGGQERGLRAGTENVPGTVGLAKALELAQANAVKENAKLLKLQNYLTEQIIKLIPNVLLNGNDSRKLKVDVSNKFKMNKLPNNINFTFVGVEGEALMLYLDSYGFSVSTASACSTAHASHVLSAIGRSLAEAKSSIRFTLGKSTTLLDIKNLLKILPTLVKDLRKVYKNK